MADYTYARRKKEDGGVSTVKADQSEEDVNKALDSEKLTSGLSSGKAPKGGGSDMPKQSDYADLGAYGRAMSAWREKKRSGVTMDNAAAALAARTK